MLGTEYIEERINRALKFSESDETQITFMAQDQALTRFANNIIHQNVSESDGTVTITAVLGKRTGTATTNDLSDEGLSKAAERALSHARSRQADPDFPGLPEPRAVQLVQAFDEETASYDPELRAIAVGQICEAAKGQNLTAFGAFSTASAEVAVANSKGVMVYHAGTRASLQTTISGDHGSSMDAASNWRVSHLDADEIGQAAIRRAMRAQNPQPVEPGHYDVVLGPYAVMDIVGNLNWTGIGARTVQEGGSWMIGRMGKEAMSPLISIWDDGLDPAGAPLPFDFEGLPRQKVPIVEKGVIRGPVYDRYTAAIDGVETTGHASPPNMSWIGGPVAFHLFMEAGDTSQEEMIRSTARGLYINSFWYTRTVHPRDCIITGMTRDGVWLIKDGELSFPVKDLRFTQSYIEALANVISVGRSRRTQITEIGFSFCVPSLKISGFNFTGVTA
ncbi:MAG: TldD/PmbA family protein [Candidatus Promineifilaceae bacterium]